MTDAEHNRLSGLLAALRQVRLRPNALVKALSGAAVLWLFLPESDTAAATIHKTFCRQCWHEDGIAGAIVLGVGFLLCIPIMLMLVVLYSTRCAGRVRRDTGKPIMRQMIEQFSMAFRLAIPPPWYYMFEFFREDHRVRAMEYLYRTETKSGVYHMLQRRLSAKSSLDMLSDKAAFASYCKANGLAVLGAVATATEGTIETSDDSGELPAIDLFFKPRRGAGGRGASRWIHQDNGGFIGSDGARVSAQDLKQHLVELSLASAYIVRPYVKNHEDILDICGGALSTVRVITVLDESGCPTVTHAVLRMARNPNAVVDNFHAGGIAAAVNLDSGQLADATDMGLRADSRWYAAHPMTGARIRSRMLPYWNEVLELARRAHEAFDDQVAVGWDIAILDDGAYLVEGNKGPDLDIIQRVCREPVGNSRLGTSLAYYLGIALERDIPVEIR